MIVGIIENRSRTKVQADAVRWARTTKNGGRLRRDWPSMCELTAPVSSIAYVPFVGTGSTQPTAAIRAKTNTAVVDGDGSSVASIKFPSHTGCV